MVGDRSMMAEGMMFAQKLGGGGGEGGGGGGGYAVAHESW